ncbi:hypothetical protein S40293_09095 [Stachybotrys chartarum IBT 40293]|nr:hypothetical protein S40293_09095 [Stachybotrys chartarum IBT 40293]
MGWLWASSSPRQSPAATPNQQSHATSPPAPPPPPPSSTPLAPNEPVDPEIQKFLSLLQGEPKTTNKPTHAPSSTPSSQPISSNASTSASSSSSWFALRTSSASTTANDPAQPAPLGSAIAESLLPTEMSCSQAFDLAWACNSLGGQWNAVYRYGEMRSCSELWNDFWFCMRTKSYTGELKESMIKAHYRQKEHAKYGAGRPSSEDVWEGRTEKVAPGSCFQETFESPSVDDDEWRKNEQERRNKRRAELGLDEI